MPRRMQAPINSIKHYVQAENANQGSGTRRLISVVDAVSVPTSNPGEVHQGAIVKAVFLEYWIHSNAGNNMDVKFQMVLEKAPSGVGGISFTDMNNLHVYTNKKNILFYSQGVLGDDTTSAIPVVRQWFKIPKGKQRFGLGDELIVSISATVNDINICGFATYKEYT